MANNYIHTPVLNMTLLANGTVTEGHFLKGTGTGFSNADGAGVALGIRALASSTSGNKFAAAVIAAGYVKVADCVYAGEPLIYSDSAGVLTKVTDTNQAWKAVATSLEGATAAVSTMTHLAVWGATGWGCPSDSANRQS
jgi:hypothetical protein